MKTFYTDSLLLLIRIISTLLTIPAVIVGLIALLAICLILGVATLIASPLYLLYKLEKYIYRI
jgi:uncharacterized membrane-anchored protein